MFTDGFAKHDFIYYWKIVFCCCSNWKYKPFQSLLVLMGYGENYWTPISEWEGHRQVQINKLKFFVPFSYCIKWNIEWTRIQRSVIFCAFIFFENIHTMYLSVYGQHCGKLINIYDVWFFLVSPLIWVAKQTTRMLWI